MTNQTSELVQWFQEEFPELVSDMQQCSHHYSASELNPYHLEGDVWTHTMMVMLRAQHNHPLVQLAALCHDLGKPYTRKLNHDRLRASFYSHDAVSAFLSLEVTKARGCTPQEQAIVFQLVAMHTDPFRMPSETLQYRLLGADGGFLSLLEGLVDADSTGRFYSQGSKSSDWVIPAPVSYSYSSMAHDCVMMIGPPCSGKTTYIIEDMELGREYTRLSRDAIIVSRSSPMETYNQAFERIGTSNKIDQEFNRQLTEAVSEGKSIIVDRTSMTKKGRNRILGKLNNNYNKHAIIMLTDRSELERRINLRTNKRISSDVVQKMIKSFSLPYYGQFDIINYCIEGQLIKGLSTEGLNVLEQ